MMLVGAKDFISNVVAAASTFATETSAQLCDTTIHHAVNSDAPAAYQPASRFIILALFCLR
jgi:hypothetical protein